MKKTHISTVLIFCMMSVPILSIGQDKKIDIEPVVTCTEFIGDGKLVAHFGYENKGKKTVVIDETGSVITYNYGQAKKNGIYIFEPGVTERAFSQEYDHKDRVEWTVKFPDGSSKTTDANINSNHCRDAAESLNIIPGYYPPDGGKEYNSKIGAELTALYNGYSADPASLDKAPGDIFRIEGTKVLIEVVAYSDQYDAMISSLANLDPEFDLLNAKPGLDRATGWVDISDLLLLNEMDPLYYARPVYPGVGNYIVPATGLVNSQGDFAMHSDFARLGYDINGAGIKIGVLSNSYDTQDGASLDVLNGDLPGTDNPKFKTPVHVLKDITTPNARLSDEGRAMLQIVHDIAPGAELAFRTGYLGEQDMAIGIRALATAGCDIIVDDLSYITEPFFQDGIISKTIDSVVSEGVTFFSSAGNFGKASYTGIYDPAPAPSTINGDAHAFDGANDIFQHVVLEEGNYTLVLQWDDGSDPTMNTTTTDLDLFLSDDVGFSLLGFNRENIGGFPIEVVPFSVAGGDVNANIVIARAAGDAPVIFKYILFRGGSIFKIQEYGVEGSSTIVGHPNAEGAISVGAVRFDKNQIYSPGEFDEPVIMSFSSLGGTPVGGTPLNGVARSKPDITAPNGVNTTIDLGNGDWEEDVDGDGVPDPGHPDNSDPDTKYANFFGTSAASPHAAGVAALIMEAKSKFDPVDPDIPEPDNLVTPDLIRDLMKSTALEMGVPGEDPVSGAGFIQAHKALMTFANPTPYVESLILAGEKPGTVIKPFSFTMKGDFFTNSTKIMVRGELLDLEVQLIDEHTIFVENHPGFLGNPAVQAFTPDISPSKIDGGLSNTIYFTSPVRDTVVFTASTASKTYGGSLPALTGSIVVKTATNLTLTLTEAVSANIMLPAEAARLSQITFTTNAEANSDVGLYKIDPVLPPVVITDEMDEDDIAMLNEIENSISEKFLLQYIHAELEIEKIPLKITPKPVDLVYGEDFPNEDLEFIYEIDESLFQIVDPTAIYGGAEDAHTTALANEISLVRGIALVNGIPTIRGIALVNGVTMVRGIALVNGVEVSVEVEGTDTTVFVGGEPVVSGAALIRGIAMVNDLPFVSMTEIVRGIALVNGDKVTFDDGYMTELNGIPLENAVPAVRGIAMVNGQASVRGIAMVNEVLVSCVNGLTTINGVEVNPEGIQLVNGIPVVRGIALVNSALMSSGVAMVNGVEVPIENGLPTVRGIALVNGIPMIRGIAMVNNLEVYVDNGAVAQVIENGAVLNELTIRGIAMVNDVALVNGTELINRGIALVNGIALTDDGGDGDETDLVNLENMNLLASSFALTSGIVPSIRGIAMVNGAESMDGHALNIAEGTVQDDGSIVYESATPTSRGIAMVNGLAYVRGIAMVNDIILDNASVLVNGSSVNDDNNSGTILVFDATDLSPPAETGFKPISFITGTTVGKHWIVPGTFLSKNFDLSYGIGTLTIAPLVVNVTPDIDFEYINEGDPLPDFSFTYDTWIQGDSGSEGYIVLRDSDGAVYDPASDTSAGTYTVIPTQFNSNYVFNIETAKLHVNPYGPGTKAIKPVLNCVEDQGDGTYLANFAYKNDNEADYYIPVGVNNSFEVTGDGFIEFFASYPDSSLNSQPTLFKVGGGEFQVVFDAESEIRWTLTSVDKDQKTSNATSATSSSTKCTGNLKSASVYADDLEEELDPDLLLVYPVPVVDRLHITMKDIEHYKMISLFDFAGRSVPITSIEKRSDMLEIDMAQLASGPYFIRIIMEDNTRMVPLIKR